MLSTALATKGRYRECSAEYLEKEPRMERQLKQLEDRLGPCTIFCLQEVTELLSEKLQDFFTKKNFRMIHRLDDKEKQLGQVIAFSCHSFCLKQQMHDEYENRQQRPRWWDIASRRDLFHFAKLCSKISGTCFCIGSYHGKLIKTINDKLSEGYKTLLTAISVRSFQEFCNGLPGILAGDFNIEPSSAAYRMIITGNVRREDLPNQSEYNKLVNANIGIDSKLGGIKMNDKLVYPLLCYPMNSAYHVAYRENPPPTFQRGTLKRTVDFIFYTKRVKVVSVKPVPTITERVCVMDNQYPSDHFIIGATLKISS